MALMKMVTLEEEMKRNPELRESDLDMLKDWLKKQPHLPPMSDSELVIFLHSNYYRTEPTKTTIDTYFTVRTHVPEFFSNRDPLATKSLREIMKVINYLQLRDKTPEGYTVIYGRLIDFDPARYVFADALKLFSMITESWLYSEGTNTGTIFLVDMNGLTFGHIGCLHPMLMKKFLYYLQEALPVRLKGLHFMNTPPFTDLIVNIMRPFMKKELLDMLCLHSTLDTLAKVIPVDILPNEAGGKAGPANDLWEAEMKQVEEYRGWHQQEEMRRVNEAARPGKAKNVTDLFGVEGSFRKLDID